ncbi:MAG: glycosyltransferase family 1 protein [Cyanobacteria bacterium P01_F01_bin.150]
MSSSPSQLLVNLSFLIEKPTGLMVYAANLFPHLRSLNPTLLTTRPVPNFDCRPIPADMNAEGGSKGHLRRLWWTQTQVPQLYRQFNADLYFSPIPECPLDIGSMRKKGPVRKKVRSVVTVHDLIPLRFGRPRSPLTLYQRYYLPAALRQATHIIANSKATASDVVDFFDIPAEKITPIPLAYDTDNFRFLDLETKPYFVYLGRCDPYKNVGSVIQAFAQIAATHPDIYFKIAGSRDDRYTPFLEQQVEELGIRGRVEFLDYVPYEELPILLGEAIALVFPSLWEGFGLPVLEAMACGTPVITSNRSSLPEVAGDAALLVNPEEVGAIAHAMTQVLTDSHLRRELQQKGLTRAQQFSWAKTGQSTVEVLRQASSS